jgi:hypothetical protein
MALLVAAGAQLMCTMGTTPSPLTLLPGPPHDALAPLPLAVVTDFVPMTNIKSFGMCNSPANPQVAAATAAASGVLTPQPCIPATAAPWAPPSPTVLISGVPAFDQTSTCQCTWIGTIGVVSPAQAAAVTVP